MKNIKDWLKDLPERKKYVDFLTATMSVPILITVMVTNISNLSNQKKAEAASRVVVQQSPSPKVSEVIKVVPVAINTSTEPSSETDPTATPSPTTTSVLSEQTSVSNTQSTISCKKEVGPVSVISPSENEVITKNPICINISYNNQSYCGVMWSYRLDDGNWSEYMDKSICLYNLTNGPKKLELKIRSIGSTDEVRLIRNFVVQGETPTQPPVTATPEPTQTISTSSAIQAIEE